MPAPPAPSPFTPGSTFLVAICGRNDQLRQRLEALPWTMPHHLYGFTKQMPEFMAASDMLVTKAGPGTISEGFIAGLPLVLYARLPGQEDGNVQYVVKKRAGVWAPRPQPRPPGPIPSPPM